MKEVLTSKSGKALCLAYRDGKRCGRVAKHIITRKAGCSGVIWERLAVCDQCKHEHVENRGAALLEGSNPSGYRVKSSSWSGWVKREYLAIGGSA